jgi:cytochrome oxidase Cu insertion factor (SCO1/SenC/PrrC family)
VLASYFTFYVLRPDSIKSFGELIMPVKSIPALQAQDLKGTAVSLQSLKGQWLLVSVAPAACDEACQQNLYLQRQIRATLGREKERTDWVWLISDDAQVNQQDHLYLVDPHGDWMMRFPAKLQSDQAPKLRRDWERLLRAAVSWDQPGR